MKRVILPVVVALALVALLSATVGAQTLKTVFDGVVADWLTVIGDVTVGDDLTVSDTATVGTSLAVGTSATVGTSLAASDIASTANMTSGTFFVMSKQAAFVVTTSVPITSVGSFQPISSTAAAWTNAIVVSPAGTQLTLINVGAQTITISDTGTLKLTGDLALGTADTLRLLSDGTNWYQISTANN